MYTMHIQYLSLKKMGEKHKRILHSGERNIKRKTRKKKKEPLVQPRKPFPKATLLLPHALPASMVSLHTHLPSDNYPILSAISTPTKPITSLIYHIIRTPNCLSTSDFTLKQGMEDKDLSRNNYLSLNIIGERLTFFETRKFLLPQHSSHSKIDDAYKHNQYQDCEANMKKILKPIRLDFTFHHSDKFLHYFLWHLLLFRIEIMINYLSIYGCYFSLGSPFALICRLLFPAPTPLPPLIPLLPVYYIKPTPSINVVAPSLDETEVALYKSSCLFGKIWDDPIPTPAVMNHLQRDWSFIHGEFSMRHLSNGCFIIKLTNALDKVRCGRNDIGSSKAKISSSSCDVPSSGRLFTI